MKKYHCNDCGNRGTMACSITHWSPSAALYSDPCDNFIVSNVTKEYELAREKANKKMVENAKITRSINLKSGGMKECIICGTKYQPTSRNQKCCQSPTCIGTMTIQSRQQKTMTELSINTENGRLYRTSDYYLICYLVTKKHRVIKTQPDDNNTKKIYFYFEYNDLLNTDIKHYDSGNDEVSVRELVNNLKDVKSRIFREVK